MSDLSDFHVQKIIKYFHKHYHYEDILHMMKKKYNITFSWSTLMRLFRRLGLKRKGFVESPQEDIVLAIMNELKGSGYNLGYRAMCRRLQRKYSLTVKEKTVMTLLRQIDPNGVEARCRYRLQRRQYSVPGPNFLWHLDNHDKLKPFGFAIYGGIDGFSKKVMFIDVATTNNDPRIILHHYLSALKKFRFLPTIIRADHGTEVTLTEDMHKALRYMHTDKYARNCFLRGRSVHNQRIEAFWRLFRQHMGDFYIHLFKKMQYDNDLDTSNTIHLETLRFCFGPLVKKDIELTRKEWNEHRVRCQSSKNIQGGIPNELFHWPERYGKKDCRQHANLEHIDMLLQNFAAPPALYSEEIAKIVDLLFPNLTRPETAEEAYYLYFKILRGVEQNNVALSIVENNLGTTNSTNNS